MAMLALANADCYKRREYYSSRTTFVSNWQNQNLTASTHVLRGLYLLGASHHAMSLQPWEKVGIQSLSDLSDEKRIRFAIREFTIALSKLEQDPSYTKAQIYSYLGLSYRMLAVEFQKQAERQADGSQTAKTLSGRYFERSIAYYIKSMYSNSGSLKYGLAEDIVITIVTSGNLLRALRAISSFEKQGIRPPDNSDHGLLKLKADIYFVLGRHQDAGLAYEEWIENGGTDIKLAPGDQLYQKLQVLMSRTGHPNNLPSK